MSVEAQIQRIKNNIASAYHKAAERGAALPEVRSSENLPAAIESIPAGGLPEDVHTIAVEASDPEGGSVSGGGVVSQGMDVAATVHAEPNTGYRFGGWQEDEIVVSSDTAYVFPITKSRHLVADFYVPQYILGGDWWETTLPMSSLWMNIVYGDGKFVAFANSSNQAAYSTDGISWETTTLPSSANWRTVAYGGGKFVALTYNNTNKAAYSADGIHWTATTLPASANWVDVAYGNG